MSRNTKRAFDIAALDEDPEDDDFDVRASSPRKRVKKSTRSAPSSRAKPQKKRKGYKGSDIESEDEDLTDDSIEEVSDEGPSSPIERNPLTGKPSRRTARQSKSYREPDSDDDIQDAVQKKEETDTGRSRGLVRERPRSLIVRFKIDPDRLRAIDPETMATRRGLRARTASRGPDARSSSAAGTRRSSRISHSEDQPLVALTDSGRHERVERASSTPEPYPRGRATRGRKAPTVSTVIEASQENENSENEEGKRAEAESQGEDIAGEAVAELGAEAEAEADPIAAPEGGELDPSSAPAVIAESIQGDEGDDDDDDEDPVRSSRRRSARTSAVMEEPAPKPRPRSRGKSRRRAADEEASDFEPDAGAEDPEDDAMSSDGSEQPRIDSQRSEASSGRAGLRRSQRHAAATAENTEPEEEELAEELAALKEDRSRRKRKRSLNDAIAYEAPRVRRPRQDRPSYYYGPESWPVAEDDDQPAAALARGLRGGKAAGPYRSIWETAGPFGIAGGPTPNVRASGTTGGRGGDSDSSDDEGVSRPPRGLGGTTGMTPTSATAPMGPLSNDAAQGPTGGPANLGKVTNRKALADADQLGVDQNVTFDGVGGLSSHKNQLHEMVVLPLLYPELFQRYHLTPPRGVLFHGPPGTGKTLVARALANSVSDAGKRVTFYMRKGADTLSKYVGEAERQLRLLFEDARRNQPSIIFFDEIDGLAPVRSSKQDQIHATIVTTLLALMDGMDGRGQVIVIGATNRPDTVDSALRRPGRFDREFYFPLPDVEARRTIIDIHTKGWQPPLEDKFKTQLASLTNGYGGADLRALCTEAALNAVQGTYPQIYKSNEKLIIDASKIKVLAKDFMLSVNKIVPSSQRATSTGAAQLDSRVEPLLRGTLTEITNELDRILPQRKKLTPLEEAEYDDRDDTAGFERDLLQQGFDQARIFRPRMLIYGCAGMGQQLLGSALLHKFERLHVQTFDLPMLFSDSTRTPQAAIVQLFAEARRHKPSVIYVPDIDMMYQTMDRGVTDLFKNQLQSLAPSDPILLLATMSVLGGKERDDEEDTPQSQKKRSHEERLVKRDLFALSHKSHYYLKYPREDQRRDYFQPIVDFIGKAPTDFPDLGNRPKRDIPELEKAPVQHQDAPKTLSKQQLKDLKRKDMSTLNRLKIALNRIMEQLKRQYKTFRRPPVEKEDMQYLFDEADPAVVTTDIPEEQQDPEQRPYVRDTDDKGRNMIRHVMTGDKFYNLELTTIEHRLSNGYYKRAQDFLWDVKTLSKDAKTMKDDDKIRKANMMLTNVSVDIETLVHMDPELAAECEQVYAREQERNRLATQKAAQAEREGQQVPTIAPNVPPHVSATTTATTGPVVLGERLDVQPNVPPPALKKSPLEAFRSTPLSNGLSNGVHPGSNGYADSGHGSNDDIHLPDSQEEVSPRPTAQQPRPLGQSQSQGYSQRSAITPLAAGSQAEQYHNSASTTTSGNRTSSKSKSSGNNTQTSNGVARSEQPNLDLDLSGGSQLPDTQEQSSGHSGQQNSPTQPLSQLSQASQASIPPPTSTARPHRSSIGNILNPNPNDGGTTAAATTAATSTTSHALILETQALLDLQDNMVKQTRGFSVEQLEQMNAVLMDTVWQCKGNWNRTKVCFDVRDAFNEAVKDMEEAQAIMSQSDPASQ